jgi:hypothetical protein
MQIWWAELSLFGGNDQVNVLMHSKAVINAVADALVGHDRQTLDEYLESGGGSHTGC